MLSQFITPDLILGLAALIFPVVWHAARALLLRQVEKLPSNQQAAIQSVVSSAVRFVEQSYPELHGSDKKVQAMQVIDRMLKSRKIEAGADEVSVLIEEAVFLMNGGKTDGVEPGQSTLGFTK